MAKKNRFMKAVFAALVAVTASSAFVSCAQKEKTTVIRESATPPKEEPGIEFKVKTDGGVDVEGKIPTEKK